MRICRKWCRRPSQLKTLRESECYAKRAGIANGEYIIALAILDPAGMLPSARFAAMNYFNGGRHPIGVTGVGVAPGQYELSPDAFDDPAEDDSLRYSLTRKTKKDRDM